MRVKIVLNPVAGRGRGARVIELLLSILRQSKVDFDLAVTGQRGAGKLLAKQAVAEQYDVVVAVGGDGTVNEVVNGIAGSRTALGVVPVGTGNDFAVMIGVPKDPAAALRKVLQGGFQTIDLCRVNERFYVSSVGAGFDGEVAYAANHHFKRLRGMIVYILAVFRTVFSYRPRRVRLVIDGETFEQEITLIAVANSRTYGGGMKVAPDALIDDGLFEICLAKRMTPLQILMLLPKFIQGRQASVRGVTMMRAREVELISDTPIYYQIDGEVLQDKQLVFRLIPHGLMVAGAEFEASTEAAAAAGES